MYYISLFLGQKNQLNNCEESDVANDNTKESKGKKLSIP